MAYRRDRNITSQIPAYRIMLAAVTPSRAAATVWFEQTLDLSEALPWLEGQREASGEKLTFLSLYMAAVGRMLHAHPNLNRYCKGTRFWQRDGVQITVSAKKSMEHGAKVLTLKVPIEEGDGPLDVHRRLRGMVDQGRTERITQEKEYDLLRMLPGFVLRWAIGAIHFLDGLHLLPGFFADGDGMFTSMFIANLGSVGLPAAYHHLFEYGNCPFFAVIGRIYEEPGPDGEIRSKVDIKYTYDERIEDGLACALALAGLKELIEDPRRFEEGVTDYDGRAPIEARL